MCLLIGLNYYKTWENHIFGIIFALLKKTKEIIRAKIQDKKLELKIFGGLTGNTSDYIHKIQRTPSLYGDKTRATNQRKVLVNSGGVAVHTTAYTYKIQKNNCGR